LKKPSILIRTKNEARSIAATLDRVCAQTIQAHEILVIDSGSRDATLEIASRYPVTIVEIPPQEWSYSRALNLGAEMASGDVLVCLSAHCLPPDPLWLERLLGHLNDPRVAASWGPSYRPGSVPPFPGPPVRQEPGTYTLETRTFGLENSNSAVRRSLWEEFRFDESLPATEDKAWGLEAMNRGFCLVFDSAAFVWHENHSALNSFRRSRAVLTGFRMLFPELETTGAHPAVRLVIRIARNLAHHVRHPAPRKLVTDIRRAPSIVAAVIGKVVAWRW
jgi:rhamnosyltransferase